MKRLWLLILLVSVGLNLGLAWQMWKEGDGTKGLHARHEGRWSKNQERHWPAKGDSAAWHRMGHERMDRVSSRLELDQEQAEAFRESHAETIHRLGDKRALVRESRDELRALMAELSVLDPDQRTHYLRMMPFGANPGFEGRSGRGRGGHGHD
jgi:hypothetical protein